MERTGHTSYPIALKESPKEPVDESAPKSRFFEIVGTVAKYYFDGMPSVQLFKRSIVQLIVHN